MRITSAAVSGASQDELKATCVRVGSRILKTCSRYVWAFASISSRVNGLRVSDRPVGSPIIPVKSPMTK
jgi:hypothetical protein